METLDKIVVLFAGLSILAAVGFLIYLVWDEWQHRKKSKRLEREWREAMAELCAAAGIDPDEPDPEADAAAWIWTEQPPEPEPKQKPPKPPKPKPAEMDSERAKKPRRIVYNFPEQEKDFEQGR